MYLIHRLDPRCRQPDKLLILNRLLIDILIVCVTSISCTLLIHAQVLIHAQIVNGATGLQK